MTTCKAWCGRPYEHGDVPVVGGGDVFLALPDYDAIGFTQPAYCSQACLDAATAKPATTAPVGRRLATLWRKTNGAHWCNSCGARGNDDYVYENDATLKISCEACAPSMGVFASEPAAMGQPEDHSVSDDAPFELAAAKPAADLYIAGVRVVINDCAADDTGAIQSAINEATLVQPPEFRGPGIVEPLREIQRELDRAAAAHCARCTHTHQGPCDGRSPFGEFSCPCGHEKAEKAERVVGRYDGRGGMKDRRAAEVMRVDNLRGATATLLANLGREKVPPRREVKQVARYADGVNLDWWEL